MNIRAIRESFIPILGFLGLLFLLLLYVRYQVGLEAQEVTVITIHAASEEAVDGDLVEDEPDALLASDKQANEILDLISGRKWKEAELRLKQLVKQRNDALSLALFGMLRYKQQRYDEALEILDRAAKKSPLWPNLFFYRGLVNSQLGKNDDARADYLKLIEFNPNHFEAHYNLGLLLARQHKYSEAVAVFEQATNLAGGARRARAHYQLGRAWLEQGDAYREQAVKNFNLAIRHSPTYVEPRISLARMEPDTVEGRKAAVQQLKSVLELDPGNPTTLFALAQFVTDDDLDNAINRYRELLQFSPEHIAGRYNLGLLLLKIKRWREAREQFDKVIEYEPKNVTAFFNRGRANYRLKEYQSAIADYQQALALQQGNYPEALLNMGLVYVALKDFDAAKKSYQQALAQRKDYDYAWYNLGMLHMRQEQNDEAMEDFKHAVSLRPDYFRAWFNLGVLYARKEQNDESIAAYETALKINPNYTKARLNLALRWEQKGQPLKAIEQYQKALEADDTYSSAWYNLALVYIDIKHYEDAEDALRKMLELEPDSVNARALLADAFTALGRYDDAVSVLEQAVDIEADSTTLRLALAKSLRKTGALQRARSEIYKGLALQPENEELHAELALLDKQLTK